MRAAIAIMTLAAAVATACSEVGAPCDFEFGPTHGMPDLEMLVGDTVETDLRDHFGRVECSNFFTLHEEIWLVRSSDPSAVAVSKAGAVLTTVALAVADSVRVTVGVVGLVDHRDEDDPPHEFLVRVRPAGR